MNHKFWNKDRAEDVVHIVKNAEASVTIKAGQPCVYVMNGTDDGLGVVLPSTSTAAKTAFLMAGVAIKDIAVGTIGNVQVYGFNRNTRILRATRGASSDVWISMPAIAIGDVYSIDTVNNGFRYSGVGSNIIYQPALVVAEAIVSITTTASSAYAGELLTATAHYLNLKTFLRLM